MTVDEAISEIGNCRDDTHCKRERACFVLLEFAKGELDSRRRAAEAETPDPETVAHYAPNWQTARPDLSAA